MRYNPLRKKKARKKPVCNSSFRETLPVLFFLKPQFSGKRPPLRADLAAQGSPRALLPLSRLHRRRFSRAGVSPGLDRSPTDTSAPAAAPHPPSPPNRSPASRPAPRAAPPPRLTPACPYTTGPRRRLMLPSASASRGGRPCGREGGRRRNEGFAAGGRSLPGPLPPSTILTARLRAAAGARTPPRRSLSPTAHSTAGAPPASCSLPSARRSGFPTFAVLVPGAR